ncbi:MAG: phosphatase PAP2 family protein, partial [Candidatus Eremiobacteraeota bacterium]|nr:phosphatase PAP2 family protein [Candidatus Eremiobacteraeota bacterium]
GVVPVSSEAAALFASGGGTIDIYGKAYNHPAGSPGADAFGDSRPFQTEPDVVRYSGADFFGVASSNDAYLNGPAQNLVASPSFPSGHTTYGYTESLLLGIMVPERYTQMIARGAEYGNSRIVIGAHYAMDVLAGRTLAYYDMAHLLADSPAFLGQTLARVPVTDYQSALAAATADVAKALAARCGTAVAVCASGDTGRFSNAAVDKAFYESTQTYGLPIVYDNTALRVEDIAVVAPEAGYLLKAAFPTLTLAQADQILTDSEGPGGGFLDNGSAFGAYSRLDLFKAGEAAALATRGGR